jgi:hypothetical protein
MLVYVRGKGEVQCLDSGTLTKLSEPPFTPQMEAGAKHAIKKSKEVFS